MGFLRRRLAAQTKEIALTRPAPFRARSSRRSAAARLIAVCLLLAAFGLTAAAMATAAPAIRIVPASADFGTMNQQEQASALPRSATRATPI